MGGARGVRGAAALRAIALVPPTAPQEKF